MTLTQRPKRVRTRLAIIVPALNEAACLPRTLDSIRVAAELLRARAEVETIVVDNDSDDETAAVARAKGATVVRSRCGTSREPGTPERDTPPGTCSPSSTRT